MSFLSEALAAKKVLYTAVCAKLLAIANGAQEHSLNDGQIDQSVKNADLSELNKMKSMLENEIAEAEGEIASAVYIY